MKNSMFFVALGCCILFIQCNAFETSTDSFTVIKVKQYRSYSEYLHAPYIKNQFQQALTIQNEVCNLLPNITIPEHEKHLKQILEQVEDILKKYDTLSDEQVSSYLDQTDKKLASFKASMILYKDQELKKSLNQKNDDTYLFAGALAIAGIAALLAIIASNEKEEEKDKVVYVG